MAEADWVLAVVVEAAARAAAALQAGAAARAVPEVCGKPVNQARRLAAVPAAELVQAVLAVVLEMAAAVEAEPAVAVDLVVADRAVADRAVADRVEADRAVVGRVVEEASADRAEEQVVAGLVVVAAREAEPEVEQAVGPVL